MSAFPPTPQPDYYCINGIRFSCPTIVCWPLPVTAVASAGAMEQQGLGTGDTLTVTFNKPTNQIPLNTSDRVYALFNFSAYIGQLEAYVSLGLVLFVDLVGVLSLLSLTPLPCLSIAFSSCVQDMDIRQHPCDHRCE